MTHVRRWRGAVLASNRVNRLACSNGSICLIEKHTPFGALTLCSARVAPGICNTRKYVYTYRWLLLSLGDWARTIGRGARGNAGGTRGLRNPGSARLKGLEECMVGGDRGTRSSRPGQRPRPRPACPGFCTRFVSRVRARFPGPRL